MTSSFNPAAGPAHGDLIIAKDTAEKKMFTLGVVPGPAQVRFQTHEQAVAAASAWASQRRVAIWFTENGKTFTVVRTKGKPTPSRETKNPRETL